MSAKLHNFFNSAKFLNRVMINILLICIFAHMRLFLIATLSLFALIIDYCFYVNITKRAKHHRIRQWVPQTYLGYAIAVDIFIFAFIFLRYRWPFYGPNSISPLPLWLAWFFFLNTIPKCAYFLFFIVSKRVGKRVGKLLRRSGEIVALCLVFLLIKGALYNTRHFEIKEIAIESPKIPHSFEGYRVALFSDIHLGNLSGQKSFLSQFVRHVQHLKPDIILFAGDLVNMYANEITQDVQVILSQMRAPDGVFSVLGNHDMGAYIGRRAEKIASLPRDSIARKQQEEIVKRMHEIGWRVLQNESILIVRKNDSMGLCGVSYPPIPPLFSESLTDFDPVLATQQLDISNFNMMLCHTPKVWEDMGDSPALKQMDLMLSGHTHAMQMKIEIGSRKWSPAKWFYRYWGGLYKRDSRYLYVNEGLGYVLYPMRIGGKPEITIITLIAKSNNYTEQML